MILIPVTDTYAQTLNIQLDGQDCTINLYQKSTGLYCDLVLAGTVICTGIICQNLNRIVRAPYTGFVGDLIWIDTEGAEDPSSPGLGTRYLFIFLEAADVLTLEAALAVAIAAGASGSSTSVTIPELRFNQSGNSQYIPLVL